MDFLALIIHQIFVFGEYGGYLTVTEQQLAQRDSIENFINTLTKQKAVLTEFDDAVWTASIESVTVSENGNLLFRFLNGTEI